MPVPVAPRSFTEPERGLIGSLCILLVQWPQHAERVVSDDGAYLAVEIKRTQLEEIAAGESIEGYPTWRYKVTLVSGNAWELVVSRFPDQLFHWGVVGDLYHGPVWHPGEATLEAAREAGLKHIERLDAQGVH